MCARAAVFILVARAHGARAAACALMSVALALSATTASATPSFGSISCARAGTYCVAVSRDGYATAYEHHAWTRPVLFDAGAGSGQSTLSGVSCGSPALCLAYDSQSGDVFLDRAGAWSTPQAIDPNGGGLQALSCASSSFCLALDYAGQGVTYDGTTWSAPGPAYTAGTFASLSCASAAFCLAGDDLGNAAQGNGGRWGIPVQIASGATPVDAVACSSRSFCATAAGASLAFYEHGSWRKPSAVGGSGVTALACTSAPMCLAIDGGVLASAGQRWTRIPAQLSGPSPSTVSCSAVSCVVLDSAGSAVLDERGVWSALGALPGAGAFRPAGLVRIGAVRGQMAARGRRLAAIPLHCFAAACLLTVSLRRGSSLLAASQRRLSPGARATVRLALGAREARGPGARLELELVITEAGRGKVVDRNIALIS